MLPRRGDHETTVLHALRAQDEVRDVLHETRFAAQHDDLKAMVRVEMHVHGRDDGFEVIVLDDVRALLDEAKDALEDDAEASANVTVNLV